MSFGSEKCPLSWPHAPAKGWLHAGIAGAVSVVALTIGLAAGFVVGRQAPQGSGTSAHGTARGEAGAILADALSVTVGRDGRGQVFSLKLLNTGDRSVSVTGLNFADVRSDSVLLKHVSLPPGGWSSLEFSAPPDCSGRDRPAARSVHLWLREEPAPARCS